MEACGLVFRVPQRAGSISSLIPDSPDPHSLLRLAVACGWEAHEEFDCRCAHSLHEPGPCRAHEALGAVEEWLKDPSAKNESAFRAAWGSATDDSAEPAWLPGICGAIGDVRFEALRNITAATELIGVPALRALVIDRVSVSCGDCDGSSDAGVPCSCGGLGRVAR